MIKVSEDVYQKLNRYAGILRARERKPVSINAAITRLLDRKRG